MHRALALIAAVPLLLLTSGVVAQAQPARPGTGPRKLTYREW